MTISLWDIARLVGQAEVVGRNFMQLGETLEELLEEEERPPRPVPMADALPAIKELANEFLCDVTVGYNFDGDQTICTFSHRSN